MMDSITVSRVALRGKEEWRMLQLLLLAIFLLFADVRQNHADVAAQWSVHTAVKKYCDNGSTTAYENLRQVVLPAVQRITRNQADRDDALQQVFINIWEGCDRILDVADEVNERQLAGYLRKLAQNAT